MKNKLTRRIKHIASEWKLSDFFRNFIAVVLGIIITFTGSDIISEHKTQKDVKQAVQLVKSELLINKKEIESIIQRVKLEQKGAQYLLEAEDSIQRMPTDSLNKYGSLPFQWVRFSFITDAMEMLKSSALIQKIENKELALQIIKSYACVRSAELSFLTFSDIKKQLQDDLGTNPEIRHFSSKDYDLRETWAFFLKQPEGKALVQQIPEIQTTENYHYCIQQIDETIAALDKEYN